MAEAVSRIGDAQVWSMAGWVWCRKEEELALFWNQKEEESFCPFPKKATEDDSEDGNNFKIDVYFFHLCPQTNGKPDH
jgi:hypothetical protein